MQGGYERDNIEDFVDCQLTSSEDWWNCSMDILPGVPYELRIRRLRKVAS